MIPDTWSPSLHAHYIAWLIDIEEIQISLWETLYGGAKQHKI